MRLRRGVLIVIALLSLAITACERTEVNGISSATGDEAHPPQLDLDSFNGCTTGELTYVKGQGTVTNQSPATASYEVVVGFYGSNGTRIDQASTWVRDLQVGETASFEAGKFLGDRAATVDTCEVITINRF